MTTKAELRASLRPMLRDATVWPDSAVDEWTKQAFSEYSQYFPRLASGSFSASAGTRTYGLYTITGLNLGIERVEFPSGEAPPAFLQRRAETDASFYGGKFYDLRYEGSAAETLVLGQLPGGSETIGVTYLVTHSYPAGESTAVTIPDQHLQVVRLFVHWKAAEYALFETVSGIERKYGNDLQWFQELVVGARRAYEEELARLKQNSGKGGVVSGWVMDDKDRIY